MKPGQIYARVKRSLGLKCTLGIQPEKRKDMIFEFQTAKELDFDPVFLSRFDADEFLKVISKLQKAYDDSEEN